MRTRILGFLSPSRQRGLPVTRRALLPGRVKIETSMVARTFNPWFELKHDSQNSINAGSDQRIYYVLSSESIAVEAQVNSYDPGTVTIHRLGDLAEAAVK
jgi:hypothetical protein